MPACPHDAFESLVTVRLVETPGIGPYHQARVQVRCTQCQGLLTFGGVPPVHPTAFYTVASGAGGSEVYLSGTVTPPSLPQEGQAWTRVVMPEAPPPQS
jgi:hypothetical protein